jgi:hypothetical protein
MDDRTPGAPAPPTTAPVAAAYGLRIAGVDAGGALALHGAEAWPVVELGWVDAATAAAPPSGIDGERALVRTPAGVLSVDRAHATVTLYAEREVEPGDLVHPCLWQAAAVHARWRGAETLHAGAFVPRGGSGAWAVIADAGGGKSSLLAGLAAGGHEILVDDLVVIDEDGCCAGPRCIDLRPEAAEALGLSDVIPVRSTERRRLMLSPARAQVPLGGFVHLEWGERTELERLLPGEAFAVLAHHRRVGVLGVDYVELLRLAGLPTFRLRRQRSWAGVQESLQVLTAGLGAI